MNKEQYRELLDDAVQLIKQEALFLMEFDKDSKRLMGVGSEQASLFVVSEEAIYDKDDKLRCFDEEAGKLFTKMLSAMGLKKNAVFISPFIKNPEEEISNVVWKEILIGQISNIDPKVILILGEQVSLSLFKKGIDDLRLENLSLNGKKAFVSYSPATLLKCTELKKNSWDDLQKVMKELDNV